MKLDVRGLRASIEEKEILKGVDLTVNAGEIHAIMGPNGSGKSTLANVLMGHPKYEVTQGIVTLEGEDITQFAPEERARRGLFLAFQYPMEVAGVSLANFLRQAYIAKTGKKISVAKFRARLREVGEKLRLNDDFLTRSLNEGFSGGEKKKCEILQMAVLEPACAILDETDSGLDIDALKVVADGVNTLLARSLSVVVITHYQRILQFINPQFVHVMVQGKIVKSGREELAEQLEREGYKSFRNIQNQETNIK